jgi:N-acetylmuramoyl-L-alanine amidase
LNILSRRRLRVIVIAWLAGLAALDAGLAAPGATPALRYGLLAARAQPTGTAAPYTVLSREGRRPLPARSLGGQEMFALDDLVPLFDLDVREDALAGGLTVTAKGQTIVLTQGQGLASVGGRLISLPAAPVRDGGRWYVPVDFLPRALSPASGTRIELRKPSRLVLVGDIRVPRVAGTLDALGAMTRVTLDVAPATPHAITQESGRLTVRFEANALDATLPSAPAGDLVSAIRPGEGPATVVIDLGPTFGSYKATDQAGDRGAARIVIDVLASTSTEAPAAPPPAAAPADPPPLLDLPPAGALRTIVIDAGHGGDEEGASGPQGTLEKAVTLSVARRLKSALESRLGVRVILTRDGDQTVALDERAALANNNKADLFVSLHANASVRASAAGAEVFYLSLDEYGDQAQRVARGESEALPVFGGGARDIEVILWEMAQARYIEESALLARQIEASLRERVPMSPRAIQQAPFRVLVGANMPAVLVEMGFITNPEQEKQLVSESFQGAIVQALVDSIIRYRDAMTRPSGPTLPATRPGGDEDGPRVPGGTPEPGSR